MISLITSDLNRSPYNIQKMFPYYLYYFSSAIVRLNVKTVIDETYFTHWTLGFIVLSQKDTGKYKYRYIAMDYS